MVPHRLPLGLFPAAILTALACSSGGGGNGGPMTPDPPLVSGVTPGQARVGESIVIAGSGFGTSAAAIGVTVRGTAAQVVSVSATSISATVPVIAPGPATLAVSVGGSVAGTADFTVAQSPLVITSIEPASIRAGEEITIRGEGFLAPVTALAPANGVSVSIIEGEAIEKLPASVRSFSELVVLSPAHTTPGTKTIEVQVGEETAQRTGVDFHVPPIGGSYAGVGVITANTFNGQAVGQRTTYDFTLKETAFDRTTGVGTLEGTMNGLYPLNGTFDRFGAFELGGPITVDRTYTFTGVYQGGSEPFTHTGVLVAQRSGGQLRFEYDGAARQWSESVIPTTKLTVSFGDIVTGNGSLPAATYLYDAYDPVSWTPTIQLTGRLTGTWFSGIQPRYHIGTFNGALRLFYSGLSIGGRAMDPMRVYYTALNSTQETTLVGLDGNDQELTRQTFGLIDNQGVANPSPFSLNSAFPNGIIRNVDVVPAGNGFLAGILAGAFMIPADQAAAGPARQALGFE